jgi:hypothetical protein
MMAAALVTFLSCWSWWSFPAGSVDGAGAPAPVPGQAVPVENGAVPPLDDKTSGPRPATGDDGSQRKPGAAPLDTPGDTATDTPLGPAPVEGRRELDRPTPTGSGAGKVDIHRRAPPDGGATSAPRVVKPPGSTQQHVAPQPPQAK